MRKLHWMILRSLPGPFVAVLGTLVFLLVLQFLITHLKDLVGRGLPVMVIVELVSYSLAFVLSLAVPMALLLAVLLVFGRLAESQAYAVAKSSGISLLSLTWPVLVVGALFAGGLSYFNAVVVPEANHSMRSLWQDIRTSRPGFGLEPGVFYEGVSGYAIRVDEAPPESNELTGVLIFDHSRHGGEATIVAERGNLFTGTGGETLEMTLFDGEIHRTGFVREERGRVPRYERVAFTQHRLALDISDLVFERRGTDATTRTGRTMRAGHLIAQIDSIRASSDERRHTLRRRVDALLTTQRPGGSARAANSDTAGVVPPLPTESPLLAELNADDQRSVLVLALQHIRTLRSEVDAATSTLRWEHLRADRFLVEYYKMYSKALAGLVFVLVGIPLGLMVRRRGYGWAIALSVGVFLFYWIFLVQGEKLADRGVIEPWIGIWSANILGGLAAILFFLREAREPIGLGQRTRHASRRRSTTSEA